MLLIWGGMVPFVGGFIARQFFGLPDWVTIPSFVGFGVAFLTMAVATAAAFRCPSCRGNLYALVMSGSLIWTRLNRRMQWCPYCCLDLDAEIPDPRESK
jgi:hypothetical protein